MVFMEPFIEHDPVRKPVPAADLVRSGLFFDQAARFTAPAANSMLSGVGRRAAALPQGRGSGGLS
jgi:hypothetical protein